MRFAKTKWFNSLSVKVLLAFVVGVIFSIVLIISVILWLSFYQQSFLATLDISNVASKIGKTLQFNNNGKPTGLAIGDGEVDWVFTSMQQDVAYRVLDNNGVTILASTAPESLWEATQHNQKPITGHFLSEKNGISYHNVIAPVQNNNKIWHLQITVSERFYAFVHKAFSLPFMMIGIVLFSLVLLFIFGICTWVTLSYTLKPLRILSESATEISPRTLGTRLSTKGIPSEITPLVASFNRALNRLESGYNIQQEFMATAAHELKTPLALIRAQIELKEQSEERDTLLNDVAHMTRHVQQLLLLAEVSEEKNYKLANINVGDLVDEVVVYLQPMANKKNVQIKATHVANTQCTQWQADSSALFVLLKNLLENAIQHSPNGSNVHIEIQALKITVRDWGHGANDEQLEHMFERFWRGAHRRDHGAGLGLAICKEIAEAHKWIILINKAEPGLCFEVTNLNASV